MKPIVCVTEFNEHTAEAVKAAAALAGRWGDKVLLVRSVDEREQFPYALRVRLAAEDRPRLGREVESFRALGIEVEGQVLRGVPEDGIARFVHQTGARLVVLACPPLTRLDAWALGCTAEDIALTTDVPLLLIRSSASLVRAIDGSRPLQVVAFLGQNEDPGPLHEVLAEFRRAADEVVEVRESPADANRHPRDAAARCIAAAQASGADLVVVETHPQRTLSLLHHDTLAGCLLRQAPVNVLCVPAPLAAAGVIGHGDAPAESHHGAGAGRTPAG